MTAVNIFSTLPLGGIDTQQFLAASAGLVKFLEVTLKGPAFSTFKKGLQASNDIVLEELTTVGSKAATLQSLVANEGNPGEPADNRGTFVFSPMGSAFLSTPKEELKDSFKRSYESTLKQHHGFVVKNLVGVALKTTPSKADFYAQVGSADRSQLEGELDAYTGGLERVVGELEAFFAAGNWASGLEKK
ncbi:glycolipid transfer protein domain-containing protein [Mrakia frigida]|uniref:GLTP domain-containing protein n=1 Tax=Mrakia frigida TaxID=29902 RepID=UPI003FCBFAC9